MTKTATLRRKAVTPSATPNAKARRAGGKPTTKKTPAARSEKPERGKLGETILAILSASPTAMSVKELARQTGREEAHIYVWNSCVGKRCGTKVIRPGFLSYPEAKPLPTTPETKPASTPRGTLGKDILAILSASPTGVSVSDLAKQLGRRESQIYVWLANLGKKMGVKSEAGPDRSYLSYPEAKPRPATPAQTPPEASELPFGYGRAEIALGPSTPCSLLPTVRIRAHIDIGLGNNLTAYGNWENEAGWEKGQPMVCILPDLWELLVPVSNADAKVIEFKVKLNDTTWETGMNHPGLRDSQVEFTPKFE